MKRTESKQKVVALFEGLGTAIIDEKLMDAATVHKPLPELLLPTLYPRLYAGGNRNRL
jgi:hypothetical protein